MNKSALQSVFTLLALVFAPSVWGSAVNVRECLLPAGVSSTIELEPGHSGQRRASSVMAVLPLKELQAKPPKEEAPKSGGGEKSDPHTQAGSSSPGAQASSVAGGAVTLPGLRLEAPKEWRSETPKADPMGPQAVFVLPHADSDAKDGSVRITHFPNMKGMNDANIDRWIGQVKRADGSPAKKEDAKISSVELGPVRLTIVDISGTIATGMMGGAGEANQRLIAAIVDHPKGPHFIKAQGGAATIEKWHDSIQKFLNSAKVAE